MHESCWSCFVQACVWACSWRCASLLAMFSDGKVSSAVDSAKENLIPMVSNLIMKEPQTCCEVDLSFHQFRLSLSDANSTEFNPDSQYPVVGYLSLPCHIPHHQQSLHQNGFNMFHLGRLLICQSTTQGRWVGLWGWGRDGLFSNPSPVYWVCVFLKLMVVFLSSVVFLTTHISLF